MLCGDILSLVFFILFYKVTSEEEIEKLKYSRPSVADTAYLSEPFHNEKEFQDRWVYSEAKKEGVEETIAKYNGVWTIGEPKDNPIENDQALILSSQAKHAAISTALDKPFKFDDKPFIMQYEVRFQNKLECGGAYLKLLADSPSLKLDQFTDKTEYTIMFGPDRCGGDNKLHFIFQHQNPLTHKMEEKHAKKPTLDFAYLFEDGKTHLVTLVLKPDNTYQILLDTKELSSGSLLTDMEPPVNPPKMIDDPNDKKPEDWDEREKIPDPEATKPDDWDEDAPETIQDPNATKPSTWLDDEPELIPDPAAVKPKDWDDEEDGEWEAPQIENPKCKDQGCGKWKAPIIKNPDYKGKWSAPLIANPKYKGIWAPKKIENPDFFEDTNPFAMKSIGAVGFELWSMQSDITFDNLIIADDQSIIDQWTVQTWRLKRQAEKAGTSTVMGLWEQFLEASKDKPWLWVVAVLSMFIPIFTIVYCCMSPSKEEQRTSRRKKTDEPEPDDEHEEEAEEEEGRSEKTATEDEGEPETEETEDGQKIVEVDDESNEGDEKPEAKENDGTEGSQNDGTEGSQNDGTEGSQNDGTEGSQNDGTEGSQNEDEVEETTQPQSSPSPRTRNKRKTRKD